ncbi:MAG: DUF1109 family protein [Magnetospirillum sp.]|nr:DUF1109 family protein [Magnetospirillum sp.]
METERLIARLARNARPVRRLAPPCCRAETWLLVALPAVLMLAAVLGLRQDLAAKLAEPRFILQEVAALATAVSSMVAACCATVPGEPKRRLWAPALPAAVWVASLAEQAVAEWGADLAADPVCIPAIAFLGTLPAVIMLAIVRQGVSWRPRVTVALGTLAAAALADAGLRLAHAEDGAATVLVWQIGVVALYAGMGALLGHRLMRRGGRARLPVS